MTDVNTLKELLSKDYTNINYDSHFAEIAKELMCNYVIQKGEKGEYEIIEIEFYLFTPNHSDVVTYPRDTDAGLWFFHPSGVDLTFKSLNVQFNEKRNALQQGNGNDAVFGGILIRGIRRRKDGKFIFGPNKCVDELWDKFDAFSSNGYPTLVYKGRDFIPDNLWKGKRWIKIKETERAKRVQDWSKRAGLKENTEADNYIQEILNSQITHTENASYLYRFVCLSEDELKKIPSSYAARPQIKPTEKEEYTFAEMSKV